MSIGMDGQPKWMKFTYFPTEVKMLFNPLLFCFCSLLLPLLPLDVGSSRYGQFIGKDFNSLSAAIATGFAVPDSPPTDDSLSLPATTKLCGYGTESVKSASTPFPNKEGE